jgi:predicted TIM-barrel fold metal-dependent hydrolase
MVGFTGWISIIWTSCVRVPHGQLDRRTIRAIRSIRIACVEAIGIPSFGPSTRGRKPAERRLAAPDGGGKGWTVIVDSHVHVIAPDLERYPFTPRPLSGQWYLDAPCSAEALAAAMDGSGVDHAVLVQAVGAYSFDNAYAADAARARPGRFVSAACIDPRGPAPRAEIDRWIRDRGMQGLRVFAVSRGDSWLADPETYGIWEHALSLGAHLIVTIMNHQMPELVSFLEAFRDAPVSLDHCGFPDPAKPEPLFALARFPKLHLKVSTHVLDAGVEHDGEPQPFVARLAAEFGGERMMWGSDFCQTHDSSYAELVALGRRSFEGLKEREREACLGGTAARIWSLDVRRGEPIRPAAAPG